MKQVHQSTGQFSVLTKYSLHSSVMQMDLDSK